LPLFDAAFFTLYASLMLSGFLLLRSLISFSPSSRFRFHYFCHAISPLRHFRFRFAFLASPYADIFMPLDAEARFISMRQPIRFQPPRHTPPPIFDAAATIEAADTFHFRCRASCRAFAASLSCR
jgi:hypothetical protein